MDMKYYKALVAYNNMTKGILYQNISDCTLKIFDPDYSFALSKVKDAADEQDKFGLYLFLGIAIGAVVVIAILLLVIYLKKGKDNEGTDEPTTSSKP